MATSTALRLEASEVSTPSRTCHLARTLTDVAEHPSKRLRHILDCVGAESAAQLRARLLDSQTAPTAKDGLLHWLVESAGHDSEALILLTYCLLPGLSCVARRYTEQFGSEEVWSEIVAQLIDRVRRYDFLRRPAHVAANLILDTLSGVSRWARLERNAQSPPSQPRAQEGLDEAPSIIDEARRRGVITPIDASLISATRIVGLPMRTTSDLLGLSYEAARKRRQRAERVLAQWCRAS